MKASTVTEPANGDDKSVEERNPLWLKDKAKLVLFNASMSIHQIVNCYTMI